MSVTGTATGTATRALAWTAGVVALIVASALALAVGPGDFGLVEVLGVWLAKLRGAELSPAVELIVWDMRTPRVVLCLLVGAGLGAAGAVTQGLFRNPLASPGVLGISTGAAAAVVIGFALGIDERALWVTPVLAGVGAVVMLGLLFGLTHRRDDLAYLLLTGVALNALAGSLSTVTLAMFLDRQALAQKSMAWMLGSFDGRGVAHLAWAGPPLVLGMIGAWALHRPLDLLVLGEETAVTLGVERGRLRVLAAVVVGVLVGVSTAAVGVIGFVGLVVPHLARSILGRLDPRGHGHAQLLPAAMLIGAALMLGVDTIGRALSPLFLAPGALTSLLGGAFFLWLLRRQGGEVGA